MKTIDIKAAMREVGRLVGTAYGSKGGKKSSANMTPEQKRARALKANAASQEAKRLKRLAREGGDA